jgi:hypothetical protein
VGYHVFADAWYGSDILAEALLQKGYYFTLACGKNKPAPLFANFLQVGLVKGQVRYMESKKNPSLLAVAYHDRAKCQFLTNRNRPETTTNRHDETLPTVVEDYRQFMGPVDRVDRSGQKARWPHKSRRWTMAFFWYLLGLCVSNARIICVHQLGTKYKLSHFLHDLIEAWYKELKKSELPHAQIGNDALSSPLRSLQEN